MEAVEPLLLAGVWSPRLTSHAAKCWARRPGRRIALYLLLPGFAPKHAYSAWTWLRRLSQSCWTSLCPGTESWQRWTLGTRKFAQPRNVCCQWWCPAQCLCPGLECLSFFRLMVSTNSLQAWTCDWPYTPALVWDVNAASSANSISWMTTSLTFVLARCRARLNSFPSALVRIKMPSSSRQ